MTGTPETAPEVPPDDPFAGADRSGVAPCEGEAPCSPSRPEPFVMSRHLTRLFGTDLTLIPGIGESTTLTLFAEIGADLSRFPRCGAFRFLVESLPPQQDHRRQDHQFEDRTRHQSRPLRRSAWQPRRCIGATPRWGDHFRRKRARLGTPQAITATAHKMARIIYHLVTHHVLYDDDLLSRQHRQDRNRDECNLRNQAPCSRFRSRPTKQPNYVFLRGVIPPA